MGTRIKVFHQGGQYIFKGSKVLAIIVKLLSVTEFKYERGQKRVQ
jgi:hypothetical protein